MATRKKNGHTSPHDEPRLPVPVARPKSRARPGEPEPGEAPAPQPRARRGAVERRTAETEVSLALDLDGEGRAHVHTPIPFFNLLLESLAKHSLFDLRIDASGDLDAHAQDIVENVGSCLGRALLEAVGDRAGLSRFGERTVPAGEARVRCVTDLGDRPGFVLEGSWPSGYVGSFDGELCAVFLRALAHEGRLDLHVVVERSGQRHQVAEACFAALARALEQATLVEPRRAPSLKN